MSIRKNFLFDEEIARHLEEIAKLKGQTQTQTIQEFIKEEYKKISIKKKLATLDEIQDAFHGLLTDVDAKSARIEYAMKKMENLTTLPKQPQHSSS